MRERERGERGEVIGGQAMEVEEGCIRRRLAGLEPVSLGHLPTPLEPLPRISSNLWVKRDDCTGLGMGGNKTRKLEYLVADAVAQACDSLITAGGVQSNHARQTAAAAAKAGLACHLVLNKNVPDMTDEYFVTGNRLLDELLGAHVHVHDAGADRGALMEQLADDLRKKGDDGCRRPYVVPIGGSSVVGALGYVNCAIELAEQWRHCEEARPDLLVTATSSYGTQAGLIAGFEYLREKYPSTKFPQVIGVNVDDNEVHSVASRVERLTREVLDALGLEHIKLSREAIRIEVGYSNGYGVPTVSMRRAVLDAARKEGLLLDPVYSGKAFAYALDLLSHDSGKRVLFLHTGGAPGLFAYRQFLTLDH